jgi:hypothetical protein
MKEVRIPIVEGKYRALFPEKCVYCGAPKAVTVRHRASAKAGRRRRSTSVEVPYCAEHAGASKRNARILLVGFLAVLLCSCSALFAVTTSIMDSPSTEIMIVLAFVAFGLAYGGRGLVRKVMSRSNQTMADMQRQNLLGLEVFPFSSAIRFRFTNEQMADEFARVNGQVVTADKVNI